MRSYRDVKGDKISIFHSNWKNDKLFTYNGLPRWRGGKESRQCRRLQRCWFDPWVRKIPWSRAWNPLQYPSLENPMDRGAWQAIVHQVAKSWTQLK